MTPGAQALARARQTDSQRRRERVQAAIERLTAAGEEISVATVARAARVSRAFLYRHRDLHAQVLERAAAVQEPAASASTTVSRGSLLAEVATLRDRNLRLARQVAKLEAKLSETLGEQVFQSSGLGAPDNVEQLQRRINTLEQEKGLLAEDVANLEDELSAARQVNRELTAQLNSPARTPIGRTAPTPVSDPVADTAVSTLPGGADEDAGTGSGATPAPATALSTRPARQHPLSATPAADPDPYDYARIDDGRWRVTYHGEVIGFVAPVFGAGRSKRWKPLTPQGTRAPLATASYPTVKAAAVEVAGAHQRQLQAAKRR